MNIGELSQQLGITTVTLRHYEKIGLLKPKRSVSGYRQYDQSIIDKICFIENAKYIGFSLSEISELFAIEDKNLSSAEIKQRVWQKLEDVNEKIALLTQLKQHLTKLEQSCDGKADSKNCPILKDLYQNTKNTKIMKKNSKEQVDNE
ncbi:heavy metal-responsive transcriptional regulator [Cysteiniphilum sp. QT6929]|uniref:heavy metal-responsive transcriptional regulator n=1 Tax=Cysteiniphilum sp. QT6929 TaxID=2975055 RepID=UPI0024B34C01|nr:heavy metal-responsive transcriptional regulator [Cysteiniphilum sp. QT6929]WHN65899.1 heavy metal-responsive transcriptional regulator [Cysteiniphilum sp. QT6929]